MLFCRRVLVGPLREDVACCVKSIDLIDTFWIHEIRRVPASRRIKDDIIGAGIRLVVCFVSIQIRMKRNSKPQTS
jgi:hypothetical protein